jgi:hypothetical protein
MTSCSGVETGIAPGHQCPIGLRLSRLQPWSYSASCTGLSCGPGFAASSPVGCKLRLPDEGCLPNRAVQQCRRTRLALRDGASPLNPGPED